MQRQIKLGTVQFREDDSEPPFRKSHIKPILEESPEADIGDEPSEDSDSDEEEFATQVRSSYFYKQSQVSVKSLRDLMGAKVYNNPKDYDELARLIDYMTGQDPRSVVMDFFAGSGSTGHAVMQLNAQDAGARRYILVQLPEALDPSKKNQKAAANFCDKIGKPRNIAELTKERLRRAGDKIVADAKASGDFGFKVFKLDTSNIQTWDPDRDKLAETLDQAMEHLKTDRTEDDILYELLLKLGIDLAVPIEMKKIAGKTVHSIGAGVLLACLSEKIDTKDSEPLGLGIAEWHKALAPAGETQVVFRDSAFANDVAKANLTAILQQHGLETVRSL